MFTVFMFDGSLKRLTDVKVDDLIMGDDGTPRKVMNIVQKIDSAYRITPTKGDSFIIPTNLTICMRGTKCDTVVWDKNRSKFVVRCLIKDSQGYPQIYHKRVDYKDKGDAEAHLDALADKIWGDEVFDIPFQKYLKFPSSLKANMKLYRT